MAPKFEIGGQNSKTGEVPGQGDLEKRFDLSGSRVRGGDNKFSFDDGAGSVPGGASSSQGGISSVPGGADITEGESAMFAKKRRFGKQKDSDQGPMYGYDKHRLHKSDEVSVYNAQQDELRRNPYRNKMVVMFVIALVAMVICIILPNRIFSDDIALTPAYLINLITVRVGDIIDYIAGNGGYIGSQPDIWRYMVIALAGAALGTTGAVYQGSMKNALASPTTLGVTAGATFGAMVYVVITYGSLDGEGLNITDSAELLEQVAIMNPLEYFMFRNAQCVASLAGCLIVVLLVLGISSLAGKGKISSVALIVSGQVIMMTLNAASNLVRYFYSYAYPEGAVSEALKNIRSYSFAGDFLPIDVLLIGVPILVCIFIIMRLRNRLTLLTFNEDEARSMGVSTGKLRLVMVLVSTVMTALCVSFGGNTGYVGFLVPHLTRRLVSPDFKYLLPASALMGSCFLIITFYITSMFESLYGGVGFFTSIIGSVMFIIMAISGTRRSAADGF